MLREEQLPKEQLRRVGMSESLRGRRSEEMTQQILPPQSGGKCFLSSSGSDGN